MWFLIQPPSHRKSIFNVLKDAASKTPNGIHLILIKSCGGATSGDAHFKVTAPGKVSTYAREWWTCGSGGCNIVITLAPNPDDGKSLNNCSP